MSQRDSGYERKDRDLYETPEWVTAALLPHIASCCSVWEPACGSGKMATVLDAAGHLVTPTDISEGHDFLTVQATPSFAIVTNPPYVLAKEFIEHALRLTMRESGQVAMLLGSDFDHAKTRKNLFAECEPFAKKLVLTKRIKWFDEPVTCKPCGGSGQSMYNGEKCKSCSGKGKKKSGPSENHAWFIWDWKHQGPPTLAYGP